MKKFSTLLLSLALGSTLAAQTPKFTPERGALLDGKTIVKAKSPAPSSRTTASLLSASSRRVSAYSSASLRCLRVPCPSPRRSRITSAMMSL